MSAKQVGTTLQQWRWATLGIVFIAVFGWQYDTLVPGVGGDWSWVAALSIAAQEGHPFGEDLIWTYGPLGFLDGGPFLYYDTVALVSFTFQWLLQLLLAGTLLIAARRSYPWSIAFGISLLALAMTPGRGIALGFAWCALALTRPDSAPRDLLGRWFPVAIGVLAGIMVLGKINLGVEVVALAVIAIACRPGRRGYDAVTFAVALLATALIGWLAIGQSLDDAWSYLQFGVEMVRGYPGAQGASDLSSEWRYWVALLVFAIPSALVWAQARSASPRRRWGLVALWLVYSFASFKEGFVRADSPHVAFYAASMLIAIAVLPVAPTRRWLTLTGAGIVASLAFIAATGFNPFIDRINFIQNANVAVEQVRTLSSDRRRLEARAEHSDEIRRFYELPQAFTEKIAGHSVAAWPFSYGDLMYAHSFNWQPLPVLEPSHAYTEALDRLDADMLTSPGAPERILRRSRPVIETRFSFQQPPLEALLATSYDPPLSARAIFCRYRELAQQEPWQLLARGTNRCREPRLIATTTASWGQPVSVPRPRPSSAVLAQIGGTEPVGIERLKELWLRPDARFILLDGHPLRLISSTASTGLLLSASPDIDYPPPLDMAPDPTTIAVARIGDQPEGQLHYTFLELPVKSQE